MTTSSATFSTSTSFLYEVISGSFHFGTYDPDAVTTWGARTGTYEPGDVVTLDPTILLQDAYYLGNGFNTAIVIVTLFLCLAACTLNLGVLNHYWRRVKSVDSAVPFMCFILSLGDLAVGMCAGLHSVLFILLLATKGNPPGRLMWIIVPAHYLSFLAFKVSAFISMVFAAIRFINMASPLYIIKKKIAVVSICIWLVLWSVIPLLEMGLFVKAYGLDVFAESAIPKSFLMAFFYQPGNSKVIELILRYFPSQESGEETLSLECVTDMLYTALPLILMVGVVLVATVSQIVLHFGGKVCPGEEKQGSMSLTIILIGFVFIVCASCSLYQPFSVCVDYGAADLRKLYLMGYIPFFVSSALNPMILLARVPQLREGIWKKLTRRNCSHRKSVKYDPVKN